MEIVNASIHVVVGGEHLKEDQSVSTSTSNSVERSLNVSSDPQTSLIRSVLSYKRPKATDQTLSGANVGSSYLFGSVTKRISSVTLIPHNYH